ncbi:hypothetical protein [Catenulispora subtropica]|uniref:Uncharacterized protein n=1 Tax=Catenulispora subtropica TaxID=450798 RepID=A0ABN2SC77_9ACTN
MADTPGPERDAVRGLAATLGNRSNELAARGRAGEVRGLWEDAIAGLEDEVARERIAVAYAWYQALHGEDEHGVRLAAGLRESPVPSVRAQVRVLIRNRWRVQPALVERVWCEEAGSGLPGWSRLADEEVDVVAAWITAPSWEESRAHYDERIAGLRAETVEAALEDVGLADERLRNQAAVYRSVLALGAEAGYRCLRGPRESAQEAGAAIARRDWDALGECGRIEAAHGLSFLSWVHGVAARLMVTDVPAVTPRMAEQAAARARTSQAWERQQAAVDLAAIGDASIGGLLALVG